MFNDSLEASLVLGHWENRFNNQTFNFLCDAASNTVTGGNILINDTPYTVTPSTFIP